MWEKENIKRGYRKRRKRGWGKSYIRKNGLLLGKAIFKIKKYFAERRKNSQREDGLFGKILLTALPLVGEFVKVLKQKNGWKK